MSDVTEESYPEAMGGQLQDQAKDLENYERLMEQTRQKLKILDGTNLYALNCNRRHCLCLELIDRILR